MKRFLAIICLAGLALSGQAYATVVGSSSIVGEWSNPILMGNAIDPTTGLLTYSDNTSTASKTISNSNTSSTITWGSAAACDYLTSQSIPCNSSVTFSGTDPIPSDPTTSFQIGTLSYTNGSSDLSSLIYGATLSFYKVTGTGQTQIGSDFVQFVTTNNAGTPTQNADYVTFSGLAGKSFNVYEGATATGTLTGTIVGDPILTLTGLDITDSSTGFIGGSPSVPTSEVPEPSSMALLGLGLLVLCFWSLRRESAESELA